MVEAGWRSPRRRRSISLCPNHFLAPPWCSLANLGKRAADEGWGIEPFEEHRDTHLFNRR